MIQVGVRDNLSKTLRWAPAVAFCSLLLPMAGCLILADTRSPAMQTLAVVLLGFGAGAELDLLSYRTARYFGVRHYGRIYAVLYAALALCSGVAPALFATVRDRSGSYDTAFLGAALLFALGAATLPVWAGSASALVLVT